MPDPPPFTSPSPMVSVVVPTYQHAAYIEECLAGILMQRTSFPVEVLIGEDESTDGTREICERIAAEHPDRIRLFLRSRKDVIHIMGRPTGRANFLDLLGRAKGKYIALCEGDDYWTDPLKLQKQVDFLETNVDFVLCFHRVLVRSTRTTGKPDRSLPDKVSKDEFTTEDLIAPYFIHTASMLFRRLEDFILPDWLRHTMSGDIPLLLLLSLEGKFKLIDGVMSVWRQHNASTSAKHLGHDKVRGMTHMYELFNAHTDFRFNGRVREAFITEIRHLPEMTELETFRARNISFPRKLYYFAWNHLPWSRRFLK